MQNTNSRILLKSRPRGQVRPENFLLEESPIPAVDDGKLLVRNIYLSVDPYMRPRMNDTKSYFPPFELGKVLEGGVIGEVVESHVDGFEAGDIVQGMLGWENYSLSSGRGLKNLGSEVSNLTDYMDILGMIGATAYVGLIGVAHLHPGETVFVSAAAGAVGAAVAQIARLMDCRVYGCAGSDRKVAYLVEELGLDGAFNYKTSDSLDKTIAELCPQGIDVNFENVGGAIMEAVVRNMNTNSRIALCGVIANYNHTDEVDAPPAVGLSSQALMLLIGRQIKMQGFLVTAYPELCWEYALRAQRWLTQGKIRSHVSVAEGIENAPAAFLGLFTGENTGKQLVHLVNTR